MKLIASCALGLESVLKKEISKLGFNIIKVEDKMIEFEWTGSAIERANINLRTANKVYLKLAEWRAEDFDTLFNMVSKISWKTLFPKESPFLVKVKSIKSKLESEISIQKIVHKAILKAKVWDKYYKEDDRLDIVKIQVVWKNDIFQILLDTSGEALHKRGYRISAGEAPMKETLAAGIILLSNWRFKDSFYDIFCWSWTLAIEAWLIAKNIAPGLIRKKFAFNHFDFLDKDNYKKEIKEAESKIFHGNHKIIWTDIDFEMIEIAKENARRAMVSDIIDFEVKDAFDYEKENFEWHLISNPPYGERIWEENFEELHHLLVKLFKTKEITWGLYTSSEIPAKKEIFKNRKLYNWNLKCYLYIKKRD